MFSFQDLGNFDSRVELFQFAHEFHFSVEFRVDITENCRDGILERGRLRSGWSVGKI